MSSGSVEIPNRSLFKPAEVCQIAEVQPYVLRSWEAEFPDLGVSKNTGGPRIYRRSDVERVLRLKRLLFVDGLTLAGARRRLAEEGLAAPPAGEPAIEELLGRDARERVARVREGLRTILTLLSTPDGEGAGPASLPLRSGAMARPASAARPAARRSNGRRKR